MCSCIYFNVRTHSILTQLAKFPENNNQIEKTSSHALNIKINETQPISFYCLNIDK